MAKQDNAAQEDGRGARAARLHGVPAATGSGTRGLAASEIRVGCRAARSSAMRRLRDDLDGGQVRLRRHPRRPAHDPVQRARRPAPRRGWPTCCVVNGIGGSALGPLALCSRRMRPAKRRLVVLDNVDPEGVAAKLAGLDPKRTAVNAITKSGSHGRDDGQSARAAALHGGHARPASRAPLVGDDGSAQGRPAGLWRAGSGIPTLAIPENVGGRFSVLTPVGLLPAAFMGLDVEALVDGARLMRRTAGRRRPRRTSASWARSCCI